MNTSQSNNLFGNSFLNSNYLNPEYLFNHMVAFFQNLFGYIFGPAGRSLEDTIMFFFAIFFLTIICYTTVRMFEIRKKEHAYLHHEIHEYAVNQAEQEKRLREDVGGSKNEQWSKTLNYIFSQHSSDWKLAIIEADSMLEILLDQLGFKGESLGDKLKSANQENFPYLTIAWEVHTVRNRRGSSQGS